VEAWMPDGTVFGLISDGSVQQMTRERIKEYLKAQGKPNNATRE